MQNANENLAKLTPSDLSPAGPIVERGLFVQPPEGWNVFKPVAGEAGRLIQFLSPDGLARLNVAVQDGDGGDLHHIVLAAVAVIQATGHEVVKVLRERDREGQPCATVFAQGVEGLLGLPYSITTTLKVSSGRVAVLESVYFSDEAVDAYLPALHDAVMAACWVPAATGVRHASA